MEKLTLTVAEMAEEIRISLPKAYELTHQKGFPTLVVGRKRLVVRSAFYEWLGKQKVGERSASL